MMTRRSLAKSLAAAAAAAALPRSFAQARKPRRYDAFIMDVHVHFGSDGEGSKHVITNRAQQVEEIYGPWNLVYNSRGERVPRPNDFDTIGDAKRLVAFLDERGIDVAVVFPFDPNRVARSQREVRFDSTNDVIAALVRAYPQRFVALCGHDPFRSLWQAPLELKRRVEQDGFKGMKLYPPYYKFDPASRDLDPLYRVASDIGAVLTFHTGWTPLARAPLPFGRPLSLDDVALRFPDLKINLAHAGGISWWEEAVLVAARHRNMTLDISSWCGYPPAMLVQMLDLARDLVGLDRVLYGSEHTLCTPTELIDLLLGINRYAQAQKAPAFAAKDIEMMLGLNAARVYGIQPAKRT